MASLYRKSGRVTDPKTGEKIKTKSEKWWGRYRDENGAERRVPLTVDKAAAQAMLNELVKKVERRIAGLVDRFDEHRKRPIGDHLADFERHLKSKGIGAEQVQLVASRSRRILEGCNAAFIGDISASRVQAFLADLREKGKSVQASNHYLRAIKQFTRWLVKDRRAPDDPLAHVATGIRLHRQRRDRRGEQKTRKREKPRKKRGFLHPFASACIGLPSGEGGIRTLGDVAVTPVFETGPIGRSGTSPCFVFSRYCVDPLLFFPFAIRSRLLFPF